MVAQPSRLPMSVEDYLTLDRDSREVRYEYVDGYPYMMSGGTADHAIIGANMIRELSMALRGSSCRVYTSDMRVRISATRYVYPDVSVSCDARDRGSIETLEYPRLIVEVLSPSTEAYDRGKKFAYYRACSTIEEYVLVDTQQQAVEIYRREETPFWQYSSFGPGNQIMLKSLSVSFPLASIYENVSFVEDTQ